MNWYPTGRSNIYARLALLMAIICWQSMMSGDAAAPATSKNVAQQVLGSKLIK